ncbi:MAG: monovalent cation/H(+) antiporter subunit G [Proteobacteria bacterium]|nr:monovalent cation/H(+) antiporter subunit G [Pseudomonadota bacterium]MDA0983366.1 monovalent cation/H(+) antiporter subunit G [Pseudomonadota bacterium]
MSVALDAFSWVLIVSGSLFCVTGALGLVRLRGFYTRTHAASLVDSAGAGLLLAGLLLQAGWTLVAVKLATIGLLIFFTSPAATHALANAALARGMEPDAEEEGVPSKR